MRSLNFNTLSTEFEVPHFKVYNVRVLMKLKELFMRRLKISVVLLTIIFSISILASGCSLIPKQSKPESEDSVKQKVISYLETNGYKQSDYTVTVEHTQSPLKSFAGPYIIKISFKDKPDVIYSYSYNYDTDHMDVDQLGILPFKGRDDKTSKQK
jgi:hypothetical protein